MPKKTKKEKIIADYRRKLSTVREAIPVRSEGTTSYTSPAVQPMDQAIRRDVVKTLVLAAVAIAGEVALSTIIGK